MSLLHRMNDRNINTLYSLFGMLVIVLFTSIFAACSDNSAEKQLSQAESLIIEQPDSTVAILVYMDTTNMSEDQIARQQYD